MGYNNLCFENDDLLNRKEFVSNIMKVIEGWNQPRKESSSLVVSIDASWGSGKSYLLNMWKNWLVSEENAEKNYCAVYYNAWENDDCDNAFIPLSYSLQNLDYNKENVKFVENVENVTKKFLKSCAIAFLKDEVKKHIGEDTAKILCEGITGASEAKVVEDFFTKYEVYLEQKNKFKVALQDLVPTNGKLIIFIDELDRCRPTFAVETLEIVKHYFDLENIVFIFAVDLSQLSYSISTLYGVGMDSSGYLRRFFDFNVNIPRANIKEYVKIIYSDYFEDKNYLEEVYKVVGDMFYKMNLSLRDIDKITDNFIVFYLYYSKYLSDLPNQYAPDVLEIYLYFITLKHKYPQIYSLILRSNFILFDNAPKNFDILEQKYVISDNIKKLLTRLETGGNHRIDEKIFTDFHLICINDRDVSFAEHIDRTIELFK